MNKVAYLNNASHRLVSFYNGYQSGNGTAIEDLYHPEVVFEDPATTIHGRQHLNDHLEALYANLERCQFRLGNSIEQGNHTTLFWDMDICHPKLNRGKSIVVQGCTHLTLKNDLIIYHRDYFDLGAMLYEHIPLMGRLIRRLKQKLGAKPAVSSGSLNSSKFPKEAL